MIAEKCTRKTGIGEWDGSRGNTWHITRDHVFTLCGCKITSERKGWFVYNFPESSVSCLRCQKVVDAESLFLAKQLGASNG